MFYAHAQKQTNKHNSLSLSLFLPLPRHIWASSASLWTICLSCCFQPLPWKNNCCYCSLSSRCFFFSLYRWLKTTQLFFNTAFSLITTLPPPSVCPSWDAQTLWPPRRWSFERVSSWWWDPFRPWRCSSSGGSRLSSCPCPPALGAGWPSCRWCGPRGRSSSPSLRRAARRTPDRVHYSEHYEKWERWSWNMFL